MTTFGMSAYLKLLALNSPPRDTVIRNRIWKAGGTGYDFHKTMRKIATEFAMGSADWPTTKMRLKAIRQAPERKSATAAAFALARWGAGRPIRIPKGAELRSSSPNDIFSVRFLPDFEIDLDGTPTRIHIWNTKRPSIRLREAIGTLGLFVPEHAPRSIAVLSLRTNELFMATDYESASQLARLLALDVERRFTRIASERGRTATKSPPKEKRAGS